MSGGQENVVVRKRIRAKVGGGWEIKAFDDRIELRLLTSNKTVCVVFEYSPI